MSARLPTKDDFPPSLAVTIIPPPKSRPPTNVLILLHGLGDTESPFASFARQLALPETASVSIRAIHPLPLSLDGFHWTDDLVLDTASGAVEPDAPVTIAVGLLLDAVIDGTLVAKCGFRTHNIMFFGFGQGGTVALDVAIRMWRASERPSGSKELGGIISVGGALSSKAPPSLEPRCSTPVLLCKGNQCSAVSKASEEKVTSCFQPAEVIEWSKKGDSMPINRDEMLPLMRFWGRRLKSRQGVPEGSFEVN